MRFRGLRSCLMACVVLAGAWSCGAPVAPGANLAYALIINSGQADLPGVALKYDSPEPFSRFTHAVVPDVPVQLVHYDDRPKTAISPQRTRNDGTFKFLSLPDGEPQFVRGDFATTPPQYVYAFARPLAPPDCTAALLEGLRPPRRILNHPPDSGVELSLVSTLLARAVARSQWLPETFEPALAEGILTLIENRLALVLIALSKRSGRSVDELVRLFLVQRDLSSPLAGWVEGVDLVQLVIWDDPDISALINQAGQAWLTVTFSVQNVGLNRAAYPGGRLNRHVARGQARFVCTLPPDAPEYQTLSFWLNNEQAAVAERIGITWQTRVDTSRWPDGAYVLTARGQRPDAPEPVNVGKAYLYLDNERRYVGACPQ
jgi:hypothetical protein